MDSSELIQSVEFRRALRYCLWSEKAANQT
jgi:hypothetical protein